MSFASEYQSKPLQLNRRSVFFNHVGIMILKRFSHGGLVTESTITVGCVKLIEMQFREMIRNPLRKYLISALCPNTILEELLRWIPHARCYIHIRYVTDFHNTSDSFMGSIKEIGYSCEDNNKTVQKRAGESSGTSYTIIDPSNPDKHGKAYILFREQGSYENQKIQ